MVIHDHSNPTLPSGARLRLDAFRICLERANRFLIANSICENLKNENLRDESRAELIKVMATAPMLTLFDIGLVSEAIG